MKNDSLSDSLQVLIADYIFKNIEPQITVVNGGFISQEMDPTSQWYMERVLGLSLCGSDSVNRLDTIQNENSEYVGTPVVCSIKNISIMMISNSYWRPVSDLEKAVGMCRKEVDRYAFNDEKLYRCKYGSTNWEEIQDDVLYICGWFRGKGYYWTSDTSIINEYYYEGSGLHLVSEYSKKEALADALVALEKRKLQQGSRRRKSGCCRFLLCLRWKILASHGQGDLQPR